MSRSAVQAWPSLQDVGQLPSHVSPVCSTPSPQDAEQSLSRLALQPAGQHWSLLVHAVRTSWSQLAVHCAADPRSWSTVQGLLSLQLVGQLPSQVSCASTMPSPQVALVGREEDRGRDVAALVPPPPPPLLPAARLEPPKNDDAVERQSGSHAQPVSQLNETSHRQVHWGVGKAAPPSTPSTQRSPVRQSASCSHRRSRARDAAGCPDAPPSLPPHPAASPTVANNAQSPRRMTAPLQEGKRPSHPCPTPLFWVGRPQPGSNAPGVLDCGEPTGLGVEA